MKREELLPGETRDREVMPNDGRPDYCLHQHHLDPAIEAKAREIYMARNGSHGGWWELNETPEPWWDMATDALGVVRRGEAREVAPGGVCDICGGSEPT